MPCRQQETTIKTINDVASRMDQPFGHIAQHIVVFAAIYLYLFRSRPFQVCRFPPYLLAIIFQFSILNFLNFLSTQLQLILYQPVVISLSGNQFIVRSPFRYLPFFQYHYLVGIFTVLRRCATMTTVLSLKNSLQISLYYFFIVRIEGIRSLRRRTGNRDYGRWRVLSGCVVSVPGSILVPYCLFSYCISEAMILQSRVCLPFPRHRAAFFVYHVSIRNDVVGYGISKDKPFLHHHATMLAPLFETDFL